MAKSENLAKSGTGPERTCVGCRAKRPKAQLARLVGLAPAGGDGRRVVVWDPKGRLGGRGAWVCAGTPECLAKAAAKGRLARALRVSNPDLGNLGRPGDGQFHRNGCQRDG
ncbi:MAG: YlxR family protein [Deltaproteobacteria bacterium]|jgi:predicted RNA-binding protein YlxR (DUF448 family)|nr:YlxR family protein [Deltaproteobacteria bacterium]